MITIQSYARQGRRVLRRVMGDARVQLALQCAAYLLSGLLLSAASLGGVPQPFCLGLLCGAPAGWPMLLLAAGSIGGYLLFWGNAGLQGVVWVGCGLMAAGFLSGRRVNWRLPMLLPALAACIVAGAGFAFQVWMQDTTPVGLYLLRVTLAGASTWLFTRLFDRREPFTDWTAEGIAVLALAQVSITPWVGLGYGAAAALGTGGAFPAAALAGLALDLAQVTRVPMTAVLCGCYLLRLIPALSGRVRWAIPAGVYLLVMGLCGVWDLHPLPALVLGGAAGLLLPERNPALRRKGEVGVAQVRLEMAAGVLLQTEQVLLDVPEAAIDEEAIIYRAAERACGNCPCRKECDDRAHMQRLPTRLLHKPGLQTVDVTIPCRKVSRVTLELQRGQAQLRALIAEREQQRECREAVQQQYRFLAEFLRQLSDDLAHTVQDIQLRFEAEVAVRSLGREPVNGDRCLWFAGPGGRYYVLLCDGMGTGPAAAREAAAAADMLRCLLSAGFPAEAALQSLNSLCALRSQAGVVSVDLAEIHLDTGAAALYKWGAVPSYLLSRLGAEKIGTAGPPPGLSVTEGRETVDRLSLRRGETLVLLSDGAGGEEVLHRALDGWREPPGEVAAALLETADGQLQDDATAVVIRLRPLSSAT